MKRNAYSDNIGAKLNRQELEEGEPHSAPAAILHRLFRDVCPCTGGSGEPKNLYNSEASANDARTHWEKVEQIPLEVYSCPYGMGWHLTSQEQSESAKVPRI